MPSFHDDAHESYCLHCYAPAPESLEACEGCDVSFLGSGSFDRVRGPRPSALYRRLISGAAARAGA
jgi:hypothetical protein